MINRHINNVKLHKVYIIKTQNKTKIILGIVTYIDSLVNYIECFDLIVGKKRAFVDPKTQFYEIS